MKNALLLLFTFATFSIAVADDAALHFDADTLADNGLTVRRDAMPLPADDRFAALLQWVIPDLHDRIRFNGHFVPTLPSPPVHDDPAFSASEDSPLSVMPQLRAPVLDLVELAETERQRTRIIGRIERLTADNTVNSWEADCLKLLLQLQNDQHKAAGQSLAKLLPDLTELPVTDRTLWTEFVTACCAFEHLPKNRLAIEFAGTVHQRRAKNATTPTALAAHLDWLDSQLRAQQFATTKDAIVETKVEGDWVVTTDYSAKHSGAGNPLPLFSRNQKNEVLHTRGYHNDYLMLRQPVIGRSDRLVVVQATLRHRGDSSVKLGPDYVGPHWDEKAFAFGTGHFQNEVVPVARPWDDFKQFVHYRGEIGAQSIRHYLAGRLVRTRNVTEQTSPWIALRSRQKRGDYRDVSVTTVGDANNADNREVARVVSMLTGPELQDWMPYHPASIAKENANWNVEDDTASYVLCGSRGPTKAGSGDERLLQYRRPLIEDGRFDLQYFYEPDRFNASVAIGRLALQVTPRGILEHWITDGKFDRTDIRPNNGRIHSEHNIEDSKVKLKSNAWNDLSLEINGDRATLSVNGEVVYARPLPESIGRKLGVFYWADRERLRVRNAVLKLSPSPLADIPSLQLANPKVAKLDARAAELPAEFQSDLQLEDQRYIINQDPNSRGQLLSEPNGIRLQTASTGTWVQKRVGSRFGLVGDFDVRVRFSDLQADDATQRNTVLFYIDFPDQLSTRMAAAIGGHNTQGRQVKGNTTLTHADGSKSYRTEGRVNESTSGWLRIARRGKMVTTLAALGQSSAYRILDTREVTAGEVSVGNLVMMAVTNGRGHTSVVWNRMEIRAEKLRYLPPSPVDQLQQVGVINVADNSTEILAKAEEGSRSVGSVVWSPGGRTFAYDQMVKSVGDSRMFIATVGEDPVDVGYGSMPTLSPDGKRFVFSASGEGIGIANTDGTNRRIIDRSGWGAHWSSGGETIFYGRNGGIMIYDVATGKSTALTDAATFPYNYIYWNLRVSRDGKKIVFKGRRQDNRQTEVAVVSTEDPSDVKVLVENFPSNPCFSWSPDDKRVLIPMRRPGDKRQRLYQVAADGRGDLEPLADIPDNWDYTSADWSADGHQMIFTGKHFPAPVDWPIASDK